MKSEGIKPMPTEQNLSHPPLCVGEEITLTVESIAFGGSGVARWNRFVIFVPFVLPGEIIQAKIDSVKSNFAEASLVKILTPSPERITPECPYFLKCGGCAYQHLPYEKELEIKSKQIAELYKQLTGKILTVLEPILPSPEALGYRKKIRMKFKRRKTEPFFGFFDPKHHQWLDIEKCALATPRLNQYLADIRADDFQFFKTRNIGSFNLAFLEDGKKVVNNFDENTDLHTEVLGKHFHYNRDSFFQINHSIFPSMMVFLQTLIQEKMPGVRSLMDLYCGVGFFGILLSDLFEKLVFLEENKVSVKFLRKNVEVNRLLSKSQIFCEPAEKILKFHTSPVDCLLLDPPRSGVTKEFVQTLQTIRPKFVIYISCNPATQFRDLQWFEALGFSFITLKPFDFFSRTKHVETLALLRKNASF
jgi:tRNA/tmRNA/rRNA uracil-C5-methylase (TrmA/RlmC/RlmD family)